MTIVFYMKPFQYRVRTEKGAFRMMSVRKGELHPWVRVPKKTALHIWELYKRLQRGGTE